MAFSPSRPFTRPRRSPQRKEPDKANSSCLFSGLKAVFLPHGPPPGPYAQVPSHCAKASRARACSSYSSRFCRGLHRISFLTCQITQDRVLSKFQLPSAVRTVKYYDDTVRSSRLRSPNSFVKLIPPFCWEQGP